MIYFIVIQKQVFIDPSATIHPTAKIGPNVSIGANAKIGAGVRVRESIILSEAVLEEHCCVLFSIVGWRSDATKLMKNFYSIYFRRYRMLGQSGGQSHCAQPKHSVC